MINTFLNEEMPMLASNAGQSPPTEEVDKAVVHVLCVR